MLYETLHARFYVCYFCGVLYGFIERLGNEERGYFKW